MFISGFRPSLENVSCFRAFMILYDVISLRTFKVNRSQFFGHPQKNLFLRKFTYLGHIANSPSMSLCNLLPGKENQTFV